MIRQKGGMQNHQTVLFLQKGAPYQCSADTQPIPVPWMSASLRKNYRNMYSDFQKYVPLQAKGLLPCPLSHFPFGYLSDQYPCMTEMPLQHHLLLWSPIRDISPFATWLITLAEKPPPFRMEELYTERAIFEAILSLLPVILRIAF